MPEGTSTLRINELVLKINEIVSRVDEKVKNLIEQQNDSQKKIEKTTDRIAELLNRIVVVESKDGGSKIEAMSKQFQEINNRLAILEIHSKQNTNMWIVIGDIFFKVIMMIAGTILAIKLR